MKQVFSSAVIFILLVFYSSKETLIAMEGGSTEEIALQNPILFHNAKDFFTKALEDRKLPRTITFSNLHHIDATNDVSYFYYCFEHSSFFKEGNFPFQFLYLLRKNPLYSLQLISYFLQHKFQRIEFTSQDYHYKDLPPRFFLDYLTSYILDWNGTLLLPLFPCHLIAEIKGKSIQNIAEQIKKYTVINDLYYLKLKRYEDSLPPDKKRCVIPFYLLNFPTCFSLEGNFDHQVNNKVDFLFSICKKLQEEPKNPLVKEVWYMPTPCPLVLSRDILELKDEKLLPILTNFAIALLVYEELAKEVLDPKGQWMRELSTLGNGIGYIKKGPFYPIAYVKATWLNNAILIANFIKILHARKKEGNFFSSLPKDIITNCIIPYIIESRFDETLWDNGWQGNFGPTQKGKMKIIPYYLKGVRQQFITKNP